MKVACSAAGGPAQCDFEARGESVDELAASLESHAMADSDGLHEETVAMMEAMTEDEKSDWLDKLESMIEMEDDMDEEDDEEEDEFEEDEY